MKNNTKYNNAVVTMVIPHTDLLALRSYITVRFVDDAGKQHFSRYMFSSGHEVASRIAQTQLETLFKRPLVKILAELDSLIDTKIRFRVESEIVQGNNTYINYELLPDSMALNTEQIGLFLSNMPV